MSTHDAFGWRDRAIALASLGAAALSRLAFSPVEAVDPQPLEMQVLVALAIRDALAADPAQRTGTHWLSLALRLEQADVDEVVLNLERVNLVRWSSDARDVIEIQSDLAEEADESMVKGELPVAVTDLGFEAVDRWLNRARLYVGSWPPERVDVDDAVG